MAIASNEEVDFKDARDRSKSSKSRKSTKTHTEEFHDGNDRLLLRKEIFHLTNVFLVIFSILIINIILTNFIFGEILLQNEDETVLTKFNETTTIIAHLLVGFCTLIAVMIQTQWVLFKFKHSMHAYSSRKLLTRQTSLEDDILDEKQKMDSIQHTNILDVCFI